MIRPVRRWFCGYRDSTWCGARAQQRVPGGAGVSCFSAGQLVTNIFGVDYATDADSAASDTTLFITDDLGLEWHPLAVGVTNPPYQVDPASFAVGKTMR